MVKLPKSIEDARAAFRIKSNTMGLRAPATAMEIFHRNAFEHNITIDGMRSGYRATAFVSARSDVAFELHERGYSSKLIASYLHQDHTSVLHAVKLSKSWRLPPELTITRAAMLSQDRMFCYRILRSWVPDPVVAVIIMLHPSVGDDEVDDPHVRRAMALAYHAGYGGIEIVYLHPLRVTNADQLVAVVIRHSNICRDALIAAITRTRDERVDLIVAWGQHDYTRNRCNEVLTLCAKLGHKPLMCVGTFEGTATSVFGSTTRKPLKIYQPTRAAAREILGLPQLPSKRKVKACSPSALDT